MSVANTTSSTTRVTARSGRRTSTTALAAVSLVSPLATDAYLAALPVMQKSLHTSPVLVQATLTAFVLGFAAGQLTFGPLSDAPGRRKFVVWGAILFTIASAACALAPSIQILLVARLVQGLSGGAAAAAARAMVTDRFDGVAAARRFATLFSLMMIGPVIAPALGTAVLLVADWRGIFGVVTVLGAIMTVLAVVGLPETLPKATRSEGTLFAQFSRFRDLLGERAIRRLLLSACLGGAAVFVYLGGSSFVFQSQLGTSPQLYGLIFAGNAVVMAASSLGFRRLIVRVDAGRLQRAGVLVSAAAAVLLAGGAVLHRTPVWLAAALLAVTVGGSGFGSPANTVRIQEAGRRSAGTASALTGGLVYASGAVTAPLLGVLGRPTMLSMTIAMLTLFLLQLLVLTTALTRRRGQRSQSWIQRTGGRSSG